jgi:hypothetical protein
MTVFEDYVQEQVLAGRSVLGLYPHRRRRGGRVRRLAPAQGALTRAGQRRDSSASGKASAIAR